MKKARKVVRVPVVMQMEAAECGAAALCMVLAYYGRWVSLTEMRESCGVSRDGAKAYNIVQAARAYGLDAKGCRYDEGRLREVAPYPCIVFWNNDHFVVLRGFDKRGAQLNDPARGACTVTVDEFCASYSGICLRFVPTESFEPGSKRASVLSFARERLAGAGGSVVLAALCGVGATIIGVYWSASGRVFMDRLLQHENYTWDEPFIVFLVVLLLLQMLLGTVNAIALRRLNGKMSVTANTMFFSHLLHLPIGFFLQRRTGDLIRRQNTNEAIAQTLITTVTPLAVNLLMLIFYAVIMLIYSVPLALIGFAGTLVNLLLIRKIAQKRVNIARVQARDMGRLAGETMAGVSVMETIKAAGAEKGWFEHWGDTQANLNVSDVASEKLNNTLGVLPGLFQGLANAIMLLAGTVLVMQGNFSLGMLLAFQSFTAAFMAPVSDLLDAGKRLEEMRTDMERVRDVMGCAADPNAPEDNTPEDGTSKDGAPEKSASDASCCACEAVEKLSGSVELSNIVFGYSRLEEPLIRGFSMSVRPGQRVALIGASGCGKSTVSRLISGLYDPWEGEMLFDGRPRAAYPRDVFKGSVQVVDQDIVLFEDTIANNIRLWDDTVSDTDVREAARRAGIFNDILSFEGGFEHRLTEQGRNLSGGQRQRLEIARALAVRPSLLILDEATNALDAQTEYDVVNSIAASGVACIIIAHRLSTIRDCDEILVLDKGRIAQRGTHAELIKQDGLYTQLVAVQ